MFLTPARIKDNRVSNFGSKEWMNNKVGLIEVKGRGTCKNYFSVK